MINRTHGRIEEEDLLSAEVQYSHFALNSLMAENAGQVKKLEKLLAQFSLSPEIISELELLAYIERAQVQELPSDVADFLCELAFLGMEVENAVSNSSTMRKILRSCRRWRLATPTSTPLAYAATE